MKRRREETGHEHNFHRPWTSTLATYSDNRGTTVVFGDACTFNHQKKNPFDVVPDDCIWEIMKCHPDVEHGLRFTCKRFMNISPIERDRGYNRLRITAKSNPSKIYFRNHYFTEDADHNTPWFVQKYHSCSRIETKYGTLVRGSNSSGFVHGISHCKYFYNDGECFISYTDIQSSTRINGCIVRVLIKVFDCRGKFYVVGYFESNKDGLLSISMKSNAITSIFKEIFGIRRNIRFFLRIPLVYRYKVNSTMASVVQEVFTSNMTHKASDPLILILSMKKPYSKESVDIMRDGTWLTPEKKFDIKRPDYTKEGCDDFCFHLRWI